jgi:V8-like Glu-specific endopeptidase
MKRLHLLLILISALPAVVWSQTAPLLQHPEPYVLNSGVHDGSQEGSAPALMYADVIRVSRVPWIRLRFNQAFLGNSSYMLLRSLQDNAVQRLDAANLEQWQNTSAYFNGDAVEIQLFVGAQDQDVFVQISDVMVGEWAPGDTPESQCGPADDRTLSSNPAAGRLLDIGCTAWIICDGRLVSAGHCLSTNSLLDVLEFNVPLSLPNGTLVHPGPEDQYAVNTASKAFVNGGVGNDWGVFEVFPNSVTGLMPMEAQGSHFELAQNLGPATIRITGYGVDFNNGDRNQVQQTHAGPNAGSSGTTMRYQTDTEGGNSGSPVIDDATGIAVGVHTHGGCTTGGGNNSGTSTFNAAFWAEVSENPCGGGGIPCEDISSFQARCRTGGTIQARVIMTSSAHNGESVEFTIDGTDVYTVTIGNNNRANLIATGYGAGNHTVALTNPAGCFNNFVVNCTGEIASGEDDFLKEDLPSQHGPSEFALLGNYPNPFNPSTTIRYTLAEEARVTLKVYNTLGQEVATLVDEIQSPGYRAAFWNGRNGAGETVTSGIYLYRIQAGSIVRTEKMVLMK